MQHLHLFLIYRFTPFLIPQGGMVLLLSPWGKGWEGGLTNLSKRYTNKTFI